MDNRRLLELAGIPSNENESHLTESEIVTTKKTEDYTEVALKVGGEVVATGKIISEDGEYDIKDVQLVSVSNFSDAMVLEFADSGDA